MSSLSPLELDPGRDPGLDPGLGLAAVLALGVAWMGLDPLVEQPVEYAQSSAWLSPWVIAWLLGAYLRTRRLYVRGLVREREERALTAVAEETASSGHK